MTTSATVPANIPAATPATDARPAPATPKAPPADRRLRAASALLWIAAVGAAMSALSAVNVVLGADGTTKVVETWRGYGFVVFAGLFVLLALRPRGHRGLWEIVIFHKLAMTATALAYATQGGVADTGTIIAWDGGLSALLLAAYACCRGWQR